MDRKTKDLLEQVNKLVDTRIDDVKWLISSSGKWSAILGSAAVAISAVFSLLFSLLYYFNFDRERADIRDYRRQLTADFRDWRQQLTDEVRVKLGTYYQPPVLEVLTAGGDPLEGQEIEASLGGKDKDGRFMLLYTYVIRNTGGSITGPIWVKTYSPESIVFASRNPSTDDSKFRYEALTQPQASDPSQLPAGASCCWTYTAYLDSDSPPPPGKWPMQMKHYYGEKEITTTRFSVVIKDVSSGEAVKPEEGQKN